MLSPKDNPGCLPFVQYFQFAEPCPVGGLMALAGHFAPDDELAHAAETLREAEIQAVRTGDGHPAPPAPEGPSSRSAIRKASAAEMLNSLKLTEADLESMTIDEVRAVANALDVPDRSAIVDKSALIEEILRRL